MKEFLITLFLFVGVATFLNPLKAEDPPKPLLELVPAEKLKDVIKNLDEKQTKILDRIKKAPYTVGEISLLNCFPDNFEKDKPASLQLPDGKKVILKDYTFLKTKNQSSENISLSWRDGKDYAHLTFYTAKGGHTSVVGIIDYNSKMYAIESLGKDIQVIGQIDQTKMPKD